MGLAKLATPADGDTWTAAMYNNEFLNIYNNALSLISPLTGTLNVNNNQLSNMRVENVTSTPSAAQAARLVFHTTYKQFILDDGTQLRVIPALYGTAAGDLVIATSSNQYGQVALGAGFSLLHATGNAPAYTSYISPNGINNRGSLVVGGGNTAITKLLSATGSCVWPAMNSAATISTTIAVSGASVTNTDVVLVAHSAVTMASVLMHGYVSSAGTVTVTLYNGTGAALNVGSGTLRATVIQHV